MPSAEKTSRLGRLGAAGSSIGTVLLAALVPKCPLCIAAALSAWGLGATAASTIAPVVRPLAFALMAIAALSLVAYAVRKARTHARATEPSPEPSEPACCGGTSRRRRPVSTG